MSAAPYTDTLKAGAIPLLWSHYVNVLMFHEDGSRQDNEKRAAAIIWYHWCTEPGHEGNMKHELVELAGDFGAEIIAVQVYKDVVRPSKVAYF